MRKLSFFRGLMIAALLAAGSLVVPQPASAITVGPGAYQSIYFELNGGAPGPYQSVGLYLDPASGPLSISLLGQTDLALGATPVYINNIYLTSGSTVDATVHNTGSASFDLSHLWLSAYTGSTGGGTAAVTVQDGVPTTPIPASLPLFLTGAILLYVVVRRRRASNLGLQAA